MHLRKALALSYAIMLIACDTDDQHSLEPAPRVEELLAGLHRGEARYGFSYGASDPPVRGLRFALDTSGTVDPCTLFKTIPTELAPFSWLRAELSGSEAGDYDILESLEASSATLKLVQVTRSERVDVLVAEAGTVSLNGSADDDHAPLEFHFEAKLRPAPTQDSKCEDKGTARECTCRYWNGVQIRCNSAGEENCCEEATATVPWSMTAKATFCRSLCSVVGSDYSLCSQ